MSHEWNRKGSRDRCFLIREGLRSAMAQTGSGPYGPSVRCPLRRTDGVPAVRSERQGTGFATRQSCCPERKAWRLVAVHPISTGRPYRIPVGAYGTGREKPPRLAETMRETTTPLPRQLRAGRCDAVPRSCRPSRTSRIPEPCEAGTPPAGSTTATRRFDRDGRQSMRDQERRPARPAGIGRPGEADLPSVRFRSGTGNPLPFRQATRAPRGNAWAGGCSGRPARLPRNASSRRRSAGGGAGARRSWPD